MHKLRYLLLSRMTEEIDSESSFANTSYSDVEAAGPPTAPLGFPAPNGEWHHVRLWFGT